MCDQQYGKDTINPFECIEESLIMLQIDELDYKILSKAYTLCEEDKVEESIYFFKKLYKKYKNINLKINIDYLESL